MKRYIVTYAVNDTPVHPGFFESLKRYPAELLIVKGYYRNPTSRFEAFQEGEVSWAPETLPYLLDHNRQLCPNLCVYGKIRTQPTAARPLSGLEVYVGKNSAIIGHPKRALQTVATASRWPRILASTGACTLANYSKSNAGAKGEAHHVLGALVVEVQADGVYFLRQVTWDEKSGSFTDLANRYDPNGAWEAPPAESLTAGDLHLGREDVDAIQATHNQVEVLRPKHVVLHDVFDCSTRNHHDRSQKAAFAGCYKLVRDEVQYAGNMLGWIATWGPKVHVVRSNHDEALDRWLEEHDVRKDAANTPYYHALWTAVYAAYQTDGKFPDALALECSARGTGACRDRLKELKKIHFLARNESLEFRGVEHGFHGHSGVNGARGSDLGYAKLGVKVTKGHTHAPSIVDGAYTAGHLSAEDHGYNNLPSGWARANVIQYADGKRAILFIIGKQWHSQESKK